MTLTQEALRHQVAHRIRGLRPDLADRDLSPAGLASVRPEIAAPAETTTAVVCVLRRLDLAAFIAGTCAFAASLPAERVAGWRRSFTRTIFLAGNPDNLRDRLAFHHTDPDGAIAWTLPATLREHAPLRRLLRLFDGSGALPPPVTVTVPGTTVPGTTAPGTTVPGTTVPGTTVPGTGTRPVEHDLSVATTGVTVGDCLVHLGHLLAEAVFDRLVSGGDRLVVRPVPRLVGTPGPFEALRVAADPDDPDRLRAYAALARSRS
jgi:hypothetical protein